jgi:hypothetical protein
MSRDRLGQFVKLVESDPIEFLCRLRIHDKDGSERTFNPPFQEQVFALQDLMSPARTVVHLKPRQVGRSTLECAYNFYYTYWCPDACKTIIMAHEADATDAIHQKIKTFHETLPSVMQRPIDRSNKKELVFSDTHGGFRCLTAGGKGGGRAWTYQRIHADEMAYWPNAHDVWASITSTTDQNGKHYRASILSTPNGPGNLFHEKVKLARQAAIDGDDTVRFRFFKWSDHHSYRMTPPDKWEPDHVEWELMQTHGLDLDQVYWRWHKINGVDGVGIERFRREYPLTVEEGFMVFDGSWFDAEYLNEVLSTLRPTEGQMRIFERPDRSITYAIGVDPSWCNGGDYAVAQVLSSDGRQVATFSTNQGGDVLFAEKVADLSMTYGKARVLVEANPGGAGTVVLRELQKAGIPLWWEPPKIGMRPSRHPKPWKTTRGNKEEGYSHLRQMVNGDVLTLNDETTVIELMHIREQNGKIEGQDGEHDDHAMALMLAEVNRRTLPKARVNPSPFRRRYTAEKHPFSYKTPIR